MCYTWFEARSNLLSVSKTLLQVALEKLGARHFSEPTECICFLLFASCRRDSDEPSFPAMNKPYTHVVALKCIKECVPLAKRRLGLEADFSKVRRSSNFSSLSSITVHALSHKDSACVCMYCMGWSNRNVHCFSTCQIWCHMPDRVQQDIVNCGLKCTKQAIKQRGMKRAICLTFLVCIWYLWVLYLAAMSIVCSCARWRRLHTARNLSWILFCGPCGQTQAQAQALALIVCPGGLAYSLLWYSPGLGK